MGRSGELVRRSQGSKVSFWVFGGGAGEDPLFPIVLLFFEDAHVLDSSFQSLRYGCGKAQKYLLRSGTDKAVPPVVISYLRVAMTRG